MAGGLRRILGTFLFVGLLLPTGLTPVAYAAVGVPEIINHQGRLLDSSGNLLGGSGTEYCFKFSFYDDSVVGGGDVKLWPTGAPSTMTATVKNGVFNVGIGDTAAGGDTLDFDFQSTDTTFLNIEVATKVGATCAAGDGAESFENLSPRQPIYSSGYAINSNTVGGFTPSQTPTGSNIPVLTGGVLGLAGNIDTAGIIQAGSGNTNITTATGALDADALGLISGDGVGGTSTGSGLEVDTDRLGLLQGCANGEILKWNDGTSVWACGADSTGGTATLDDAYTNGSTVTLDSGNVSLNMSDATNDYHLVVDNTSTGVVSTALVIASSGVGSSITTAMDLSAVSIVTALALGSNDVTVGGVTIDATEFARLDGKDAALVDLNDAVNTAITGTGALNSGSITSGFGTIDTGADNITTTGSSFANDFDRSTAGALTFGNTNATSVSVCNSAACDTITLGTNADADTITIGDTLDAFSVASTGLNVSTAGALTGVASIDTIATSATALTFAGAGTISSTTISALTLDTGTTGTLNLGTGNNAKTINLGTGTAGNAVNIGTDNTTADTIAIGSALDTVTLTGNSSSTLVWNGVTISAAELALLDGHDAALVDTNDAVSTAITGTGALNSGSITSGFGTIDTGADNITTTGSVFGNAFDRSTVGALTFGATNATSLTIGGASVTALTITTDGTGDGEVVLPTGSISGTEILNDTVALTTDTSGDYVASFTAGGGLTGDATGEGSTPTIAVASANGAIVVNADNIALTVAPAADALSATTSSGSGLEVLATGLTLLQGCADTEILKWNETTDVWACAADSTGGTTSLDSAYNNGGTITVDAYDVLLNLADATNDYKFTIDNATTGNIATAFTITSTGVGGTTTTAIDLSDADIVTALALGLNDVIVGGATISSTEFALLDGHDAALVDTNDAVSTAITGTGALNSGSITSGFGTIDTGADNITTTGSSFANDFDRSTAGALTFGNTNATSVSVCNSAACDTITLGTNADADTITIGDTLDAFSVASTGLNVSTAGALTGVASLDTIATSATALTFAGAGTISSTTISALTLDTGTTGTLNLGTGNNAKTINLGTGTAGNTVNIGTDNTTADTLNIGSALDTLTLTGSSSSTFVLNGVTVDATEFNRLDGHDAALVDTNDAVSTAITGTGALNSGSITSGFGAIDVGADNITTTGSSFANDFDRSTAGALTFGNTNATSVSVCNSINCDTITLGTNADADTITIGDTLDAFSVASTGLNVSTAGALTGVASIDTIATSATALTFAGAGTISSTTISALTLDTGTTGTLNLGTGNNAKTINLATGTAGNAVNIGTDNTTADTISIGSALDTVAITGNSSSTLVWNGVTISAAELALLDGHDAALVDTNDAVSTAITGTGALNSGSITSGFGTIDTGADNITTTGSSFANDFDRSTAGALTFGNTNATSVSVCNSATCDTITLGTNVDADTITIGEASDSVSLVSANWSISTAGAGTFASVSVGGDTINDFTGNGGLAMSGNALILKLAPSADALSATTSSGSGMEVLATGLAMVQGCSDGQILKWNETTDVWACGTDVSGGSGSLQNAYDGGATITTAGAIDIALTLTSGNLTATGAGAVNLTPTSASSFTSGGALTLTGGAASTWSTSTGALQITGGSTLTLNSTTTSAITLDSGTTGTVNVGTGNNAKTINLGTGTAGNVVNIGTDNTTADTIAIGSALDTVTLTGNSSSTLVWNGVTISAAELALLDGHDAALVDTNDAVSTAITGTGALNSGSITSGFGAIDVGADNITTTGSSFANDFDRSTAGALTFGNTNATSVSVCNSINCDTITLGTNADADTITIGDTLDAFSVASTGLNVSTAGALTGVASIDTIATSATALTFAGAGTIASTTTSALTLDTGTTGTLNLGTGNNAKTINLGTGTAGDVINIGTDNTVADTIGIGSALDTTTIGGAVTLSAFTSCNALSTSAAGVLTCSDGPDTAFFADVTPAAWAGDNNTTELWNDATRPNITVTTATSTVLVSVHVEGNLSNTANDLNLAAQIAYDTGGANPTCGTDPSLGQPMNSGFATATAEVWADLNGTFVHDPGVAAGGSAVYTLCSSTDSSGTTITDAATSVEFTLVELGADVAENYYTNDGSIKPGDLVSIDSSIASGVKKSTKAYDKQVLGVVSTLPGLVLNDSKKYSADGTVQIGDDGSGKLVPVALAGRIPVRVSRENGDVKSGDYLTASSTPGVAMRATKAGPVIGQAISDFNLLDGEIGLVAAFVKNGYYNGESLVDEVPSLDLDNPTATSSASSMLLKRLVSSGNAIDSELGMSDIVTDKLVAGIEVVTAKVTASELHIDSINAAMGDDITMNLEAGRFIIQGQGTVDQQPVITFDAAGNAYFAGDITAKSISVENVTGLEAIQDEIAALVTKTDGLSVDLAALRTAFDSQVFSIAELTSRLASLENGLLATPTLDRADSLNVLGETILNGALSVNGSASFATLVSFMGDINLIGRPYFNTDTAGFADVKTGESEITVVFDRAYDEVPVVNATISLADNSDIAARSLLEASVLAGDIRYIVTRSSTTGFTILLNAPSAVDLRFSWTALAVKNAKIFASPSAPVPEPQVAGETSVEPLPVEPPTEPIVEPTPEPSVVTPPSEPVAEPVIEPSVVAPTSEPTPEPVPAPEPAPESVPVPEPSGVAPVPTGEPAPEPAPAPAPEPAPAPAPEPAPAPATEPAP